MTWASIVSGLGLGAAIAMAWLLGSFALAGWAVSRRLRRRPTTLARIEADPRLLVECEMSLHPPAAVRVRLSDGRCQILVYGERARDLFEHLKRVAPQAHYIVATRGGVVLTRS